MLSIRHHDLILKSALTFWLSGPQRSEWACTRDYAPNSKDYFRRLCLLILFFAVPRTRAFLTGGFFLFFAVPRTRVFLTDGFFLAGFAFLSPYLEPVFF